MLVADTPILAIVSMIRDFKRVPVEYVASKLNIPVNQLREDLRMLSEKKIVRLFPESDEVGLS